MSSHHEGTASPAPAAPPARPAKAPEKEPRLDAGNKHHDHYARRLPPWRHAMRNYLLPIVRWETPWLALMQDKLRSPALDSYFAVTANLGTHTFYMIFLPILYWCGYTNIGRAMVHMLAAGIFFTGFIKDMLCLPRPLSPPLARITMSGSAALEYGFPSSHSSNAVSVAFYALYKFHSAREDYNPNVFLALQLLCYWFAISIVFGRLYCGMHGFLDVVVGSVFGGIIAVAQLIIEHSFDDWLFVTSPVPPLIITLVIFVLVRIHPEPADDCPCFDDTVSFVSVVIGINVGAWHYAMTGLAIDDPIPSTNPFRLETVGLPRATLRILLGVVVIFLWRAAMKPTLLNVLPPIFRLLEQLRLNLPRAFFLNASKYTSIPTLRGDDNVIPPASELPNMLKNLAHPRKRSVSVGPQSAADAYETLAYRNRRRRESINSLDGAIQEDAAFAPVEKKPSLRNLRSSSRQREKNTMGANLLPTPAASRVHSYEQMMGTGHVEGIDITPPDSETELATQSPAEAESEKREIFMQLMKPRVRYDVEVVTKLIIYSGIGYVAVCANPILFEFVGLGTGIRTGSI
ncbi:hypothetical protein DPSP01_003700 [Paraphaeosphaeria sporulosa]